MSAAAAADATAAPAPKGGKKKLIIILAAVLLLAGVGGGAAVYMMKKKAAEAAEAAAAEEEGGDSHAKAKPAKGEKKAEHGAPPTFLPLEVFTVNLADREADRYAQIGITLELADAKTADQIKLYMPAIRNNILMVIAHKTAEQMIAREGKLKLAREVQREALKPLGVEVEEDEEEGGEAADKADKGEKGEKGEKGDKPVKKNKKKRAEPDYPIRAVHFSNFIIQ